MPLFEFDSVSLSFGERPIFRDFTAVIREGEKVVLRAPSGSGKSSLLRLLLGFVRPDVGEVRYRGRNLTAALAWQVRKETGYVNQSIDLGDGTVRQGMEALCRLRHHSLRPGKTAMRETLSAFDLGWPVLDQSTKELSGGERQRVALAIALLLDRPVCLLDEPSAALDASLKKRIAARFLDPADPRTVIAAFLLLTVPIAFSRYIVGLTHFFRSLKNDEERYLYWLGNGAARSEALRPFFREAMVRSVRPTLAAMATMGIVSLPGMMTGQMLGGSAPIVAIQYQIAIMLAIYASVTLGVALAILFSCRKAFDDFGVLRKEIFAE